MADEIAQVVDLEYKGIYYLLKGTKEFIASMVIGIKNLHEWNHKRWLDKPGSSSWQKIQEISEGMAPILEFPKEMFEESIDITHDPSIKGKGRISKFEYYCQKNGLRYCMMPDLNPNDDYIPVAVPAQDFGLHDEQIKSYMRKRIESEEIRDKTYDEKIGEAKKKLDEAENPEEKEELRKQIESLEEGKSENSALLNESREKLDKNNTLEFADYIKQAEGTDFLDNPSVALNQAQTCGIVREFMPAECMYLIRDAGLMPEGGELFYSQKAGDDLLTIKRSFEVGDDGLAFSVYDITDPFTGVRKESVSDKGLTKKEWDEKLSFVLKEAGIMKDQPMTVMKSTDALHDYILGLDTNFPKALEEDIPESTRLVIDQVRKDASDTCAYARSFYQTINVPSENVMPNDNMILSLELDDGLVEGVTLVAMDSDRAKISIRSDESYSFTSSDGKEKMISGEEIIKALEGKKEEGITERKGARIER